MPNVSLKALADVRLEGADSWLAPIALAKAHGISLWSDDVAQRALARAFGVKVFGTTSLQQLRTSQRLADEKPDDETVVQIVANRRAEVLRGLTRRIVDLPTTVDTVIEQARHEQWDISLAASTVGRPGWWHLAENPWSDLREIFSALEQDGVDADNWRAAAMWGVVLLSVGDPSRTAVLLTGVALVQAGVSFEAQRAVEHLGYADEVASRRGAHKPTDYLVEAATALASAGVLDDPRHVIAELRAALSGPDEGEDQRPG